MAKLCIEGYGDALSINGRCIGDMSIQEHQMIEEKLGANNYQPLNNVLVTQAQDASTLNCRMLEGNIETTSSVLDALSCYSAVNQGQLNQAVVDAVAAHLQQEAIPTVPRSIRHQYMAAFLMATTSFCQMDRVVPKVTGVEAWELTLKLSRLWGHLVKGIPENQSIVVGAENNFHGRSLAAVSFSSSPLARYHFGPYLPGIHLVPFNDIGALDDFFQKNHQSICAYIAEPIQGEAGVIVPDDDYWPKVRALCDRYNILLVLDEVQTGYGRTGLAFAHQHYGIQPDLMACGKAAGAGILPLSFVAGRGDIISLLKPSTEGSTFGGYPLACVVGVYAIKALLDGGLIQKAQTLGSMLLKRFEKLQNKYPEKIKSVRGKGLLIAVEFHKAKALDGCLISQALLSRGIYAKETQKHTVRFAPALSVNPSAIDAIAHALDAVVRVL